MEEPTRAEVEANRQSAQAARRRVTPEDDLVELLWRDFDHNTPAAFWDVATWSDGSWSPGSLDIADRKRIGIALLKFAQRQGGLQKESETRR